MTSKRQTSFRVDDIVVTLRRYSAEDAKELLGTTGVREMWVVEVMNVETRDIYEDQRYFDLTLAQKAHGERCRFWSADAVDKVKKEKAATKRAEREAKAKAERAAEVAAFAGNPLWGRFG